MNAGYLVANWISGRVRSLGYSATVRFLAPKIGSGLAAVFVSTVVRFGVTAGATTIAGYLGVGSSLAGPLGFIIGYASGFA